MCTNDSSGHCCWVRYRAMAGSHRNICKSWVWSKINTFIFTSRYQVNIARLILFSNLISCDALYNAVIPFWVQTELEDTCGICCTILRNRKVYVLLSICEKRMIIGTEYFYNTLLSELLKYQRNSTSEGLAETLQGT